MANSTEEVTIETEEVIYEEVAPAHIIETGDSVKVKQVLDESTMDAVMAAGFAVNYSWENFKLFLMFLSCVFAMIAQFYPMPFPDSRLLLAVCCGFYFIISTILQYIVVFIDKDTIMFTTKCEKYDRDLRIRTSFPRFQEYFTLTVETKAIETDSRALSGKMYVGKYFTSKGEFDEDGFQADVKRLLNLFVEGKEGEIPFEHKLD